ncbi:hypothetical protein P799_11625 [Lysinibacillus sphaericus CBAM5]|uniref:Uncharacterized protein n=1 Tax=Lysinibacillus sphaericus CBAM5 TaxID=1400869 RepID=W7RSF5_LYSSH|nr:hypothetical protein P799_11625 [Lysinibacillus sphaericus CBAM5]
MTTVAAGALKNLHSYDGLTFLDKSKVHFGSIK